MVNWQNAITQLAGLTLLDEAKEKAHVQDFSLHPDIFCVLSSGQLFFSPRCDNSRKCYCFNDVVRYFSPLASNYFLLITEFIYQITYSCNMSKDIVISCAGDSELAAALYTFVKSKSNIPTRKKNDEVYLESEKISSLEVKDILNEFTSSAPEYRKCIVSNSDDIFVIALQVEPEEIGLSSYPLSII